MLLEDFEDLDACEAVGIGARGAEPGGLKLCGSRPGALWPLLLQGPDLRGEGPHPELEQPIQSMKNLFNSFENLLHSFENL